MKLVLLGLFFAATSNNLEARPFSRDEVELILQSIEAEHRPVIEPLIQDPRTKKIEGMVDINITKPLQLTIRKYKHFTEPYAISLAKRFKRRWRTTLKKAEQRYGVHQEVIIAILLVESSFGRFVGRYQPLSVFSSIFVDSKAAMKTPDFQLLPQKTKDRFDRKMAWALGEIQAMSEIKKKYPKFDLMSLKGSYAGAFGKCQFLPSSYLNFAVPFVKGQTPDLFRETDAIMSVANYLAENGYKGQVMSQGSYESIFHYNNSDVYVKTVRNVAKKLN